ncbi:hypothetical protein Tco_0463058 [Tanacetum coccineum]
MHRRFRRPDKEESLEAMKPISLATKSKIVADLQSNPDKNGPSPLQESSSSSDNKAKTLSKVASQGVSKVKSTDKGKRYMRRARSVAKNINTGLDAEKEINTGREEINIGIKSYKLEPKRMVEEEALSEQQEKRKAQVQFEAQYYTEEDWDAIRANRYCESKKGNTLSEERAKAKRNKPRPSSQLRIYMSKLSDESKTVKLSQLKKSMKQIGLKMLITECFRVISGLCLIHLSMKMLFRAYHFNKRWSVGDIMINVKYTIFQQGQRSVYQIIRANGADTIYMSFGAMIKDFTREDLIELYRLVMQKYGTNRPEDAYDRVLWSDLRTMFDPPLNEDAIWSLPLQQKMVSWSYYNKCEVHCLTLEACTIYMLADRKYPLSKDACQVMLKMKLLDGKMNEVFYKLLKMIEK